MREYQERRQGVHEAPCIRLVTPPPKRIPIKSPDPTVTSSTSTPEAPRKQKKGCDKTLDAAAKLVADADAAGMNEYLEDVVNRNEKALLEKKKKGSGEDPPSDIDEAEIFGSEASDHEDEEEEEEEEVEQEEVEQEEEEEAGESSDGEAEDKDDDDYDEDDDSNQEDEKMDETPEEEEKEDDVEESDQGEEMEEQEGEGEDDDDDEEEEAEEGGR